MCEEKYFVDIDMYKIIFIYFVGFFSFLVFIRIFYFNNFYVINVVVFIIKICLIR